MSEYIRREDALNFEMEIEADPEEIQAISKGMALMSEYIKGLPAADVVEHKQWIPVTERLPEEKDRYLTVSIEPWFGTTVVDTMRWSGIWMYDGRQAEATVTHWMPLPQPPEDGEA